MRFRVLSQIFGVGLHLTRCPDAATVQGILLSPLPAVLWHVCADAPGLAASIASPRHVGIVKRLIRPRVGDWECVYGTPSPGPARLWRGGLGSERVSEITPGVVGLVEIGVVGGKEKQSESRVDLKRELEGELGSVVWRRVGERSAGALVDSEEIHGNKRESASAIVEYLKSLEEEEPTNASDAPGNMERRTGGIWSDVPGNMECVLEDQSSGRDQGPGRAVEGRLWSRVGARGPWPG
ncbi:hypothetical protein C8R43DRAFT_1199150 [Mycena crocata]|nr:hypothetical protein C8R43DRAFT_1199150 [Mycena crocata]